MKQATTILTCADWKLYCMEQANYTVGLAMNPEDTNLSRGQAVEDLSSDDITERIRSVRAHRAYLEALGLPQSIAAAKSNPGESLGHDVENISFPAEASFDAKHAEARLFRQDNAEKVEKLRQALLGVGEQFLKVLHKEQPNLESDSLSELLRSENYSLFANGVRSLQHYLTGPSLRLSDSVVNSFSFFQEAVGAGWAYQSMGGRAHDLAAAEQSAQHAALQLEMLNDGVVDRLSRRSRPN